MLSDRREFALLAVICSRPPPNAQHDAASCRSYRPELQGLRAMAVALVVVDHVWSGRESVGLDVFFVVSGFLLTAQLFRAAQRGRIELRPLWARTIKRLFPAAMTVLLAVTAASIVVLPQTRWFLTIREIAAAALYVENWRLATDPVDHHTRYDQAGVVQHFWALSVQGQFCVVWPLLVALVVLAAGVAGRSPRRVLSATLCAIFGASLAYSVWLTRADQSVAYVHSLTRVWEFALGGLVAVGAHAVALARWHRVVLGWAGVLALPVGGLVMRVGSEFPGYLALWPTLCAAAVIVAGATGSRWGADRLLGWRPLTYLGDLSYCLYLWHWPVLVFYLVAMDRITVGWRGGATMIAVSLVLSITTHHLIEKPLRASRIGVRTRWGAYRLGVAALAAVLLAVSAWQVVSVRKAAAYALSMDDPDHPGALARSEGFEYWGAESPALVPPLAALPHDWAGLDPDTCVLSPRNTDLEICTSRMSDPAKRIVLVGESHIGQWVAAIKPVAERRHWQMIVMARGGCPFSAGSEGMTRGPSCLQWNADATAEILALRPDAVFTLATHDVRAGLTERTPAGFVQRWRELGRAGIPVLAVRDNPRFDYSPPECVMTHGADAARCSTPRAELLTTEPPYRRVPDLPTNVSFLDVSDYYCTEDVCPPVVGNVLVYLDENHTSATFMATLAPIVDRLLPAALGW